MRCIKPNQDKAAARLDEAHCRHQVAYLGLLENVRVRRAGFASRQPYPRFLLRYSHPLPVPLGPKGEGRRGSRKPLLRPARGSGLSVTAGPSPRDPRGHRSGPGRGRGQCVGGANSRVRRGGASGRGGAGSKQGRGGICWGLEGA